MKTSTSMVLGRLVVMYPEQQIVTGEAVAVDLRLAGVGSRGAAALIDLFLVAVLQLAVLIPILIFGVSSGSGDGLVALLIVGIVGISVGYPVGMETLWRGRTLGKAIMGLRVVRDDGGPIRFRHALVRGLIGVIVEKTGLTYGIGALISMLISSRNKRIGDLFAGTIVVQERVPGRIDAPVDMPPALASWAAGLDLSAVDDALAMRLRQFFGRAAQLTPDARATLEHQLANEVTARVGPPPADAPAWAVISAILAERRRRAYAAMPAAVPQVWVGASQPWGTPQPIKNPESATTQTPAVKPEPEPAPSTTGFVLPR
jgi:uncharacterized RDD family membrane protein YckC